MDLVKILIDRKQWEWNEQDSWDNLLLDACSANNTHAVELTLNNGATSTHKALQRIFRSSIHNVDIINILLSKERRQNKENREDNKDEYNSASLSLLVKTEDFKLYCMYTKFCGIKPTNDAKFLKLLFEYPPYILLVYSRFSKTCKNCCVHKLPVELFRLLTTY